MKKLKLLAIACGMSVCVYANEDSTLLIKFRKDPDAISNDDKMMLARNYSRTKFALAHDLAQSCIESLSDEEILSDKYIIFFTQFTTSTKDEKFDLLRKHSKEINKARKSDFFCEELVANIILEENLPKLIPSNDAEWDTVQKKLENKFSAEEADRAISMAKVRYYEEQKKWDEYIRASIYRIKKYGNTYNSLDINNTAYYIFQYSDNKEYQQTALQWMEALVKDTGNKNFEQIDTYASLLYKLGKTEEGLAWEKKAAEYSRGRADIVETLHKMEAGQKIW